ncbi:DUF453 domain protein [Venturia nashicola]|nr:DUF453 domain protein [Venturia nashicola]
MKAIILSQGTNAADTLDLAARFISDGQPHRAIPLTAALCTAAAAKVPGSILHQCVREKPVNADVITIGHPSGRIQVKATMDDKGCTVRVMPICLFSLAPNTTLSSRGIQIYAFHTHRPVFPLL